MARRILERGEIEKLASTGIPRVILPDANIFMRRAERLRQSALGHPIESYLLLMATMAETQQAAFDDGLDLTPPSREQVAQCQQHGMPPLDADTVLQNRAWQAVLGRIAQTLQQSQDATPEVQALAQRLQKATPEWLDTQARAVLTAPQASDLDWGAAPFVMAALQVQWASLARRFEAEAVTQLDVSHLCPLCGSVPVASTVHANQPYEGYRYLHCSLCENEWHFVRAKCTHCTNMKEIGFYTLEDANTETADSDGQVNSRPVRAEACNECHTYRKIVYVEHDTDVEAVADDLSTLTLDLLLSDKGFLRASGNPLLWQPSEDTQS